MKINDKHMFSESWRQNFKQHHGIRKLDISSAVVSVDAEAAQQYSVGQYRYYMILWNIW